MKRKMQMIVSASAASVLALSALAQDTPKTDRPNQAERPNQADPNQTDRANYSGGRTTGTRQDKLNGAAKASDLIGMEVKNNQDEKLGKVEDLAVDVESGRVVQVILSTGGLVGIGDTLTAVPPGALHHDVAQKVLHLDADKERLKSSPKFEMSKWAECCDADHLSTVYRHYGQEPAFKFIHRGDVTDRAPNTVATRTTDGTRHKDHLSTESQSMIPESRLSSVQKASKLMGTSVKNLKGEKLGDVDNILVDLSSGRIVAVIVSSGGFLGIGDELSAIPPTALRFTAERDTLQLDASKEMLSNAPHFKANQWPDFAEPSYAGGVYRAYQVEPYFATNRPTDADITRGNVNDREVRTSATTEPDNTARNIRDRDNRTLTPLDQGNSKADVDTTAQIRKEINGGKNLSVSARNVKIITKNGQVTLRGPVNTAEEKRLIAEIANRIARSGNVDNQLEVKLPARSAN